VICGLKANLPRAPRIVRSKCYQLRRHRRGLELLTRFLPSGCSRGNDRISQVPGERGVSVRHVQSTPAGLLAPDHCGAAPSPLVSKQQRLLRKVFRRSTPRRSDYASRCGLPPPHARVASGRWSNSTRRALHPNGPNERFQSGDNLIPLSQACLAQSNRPKHVFRGMILQFDLAEARPERVTAGDGKRPPRCSWCSIGPNSHRAW
jgi:hypothetical protein